MAKQRYAPKGRIKARAGDNPMTAELPHAGGKCTAHSKQTGNPCKQPAIPGGTVCRYHGGAAPQVIAKAEERLLALQFPAIAALGELIEQKEFPSTRYAASRDILDRTLGKPTETVRQEHSGGIEVKWADEDDGA